MVEPEDSFEACLVELDVRRRASRQHEQRVGEPLAKTAERLQQLRDPLRGVEVADAGDDREPAFRNLASAELDGGPGRHRDHPGRAGIAVVPNLLLDIPRVADDAIGAVEDDAGEREVLRALLPDRREESVDDAVREQPADDPGVLLHRVQVALRIPAPERHPRDEVVEDEIVQDDHPGSLPERVHDPGVRLGVVADVVEADVRSARRLLRSSADDGDVQSLLERRSSSAL